jgi:uncharacterized membrane protein YecN with MAPEG domain
MDPHGLAIVAFYVGLNALLLLVLAYNVGSRRGAQNQLQPGDTGDAKLVRAIRAHANFAEHAPIALLLLLLLALLGFASLWLHVFGAGFTIGRVVGAIGMMRERHPNPLRFAANLVTGLALLLGGGGAMVCAAGRMGWFGG